MKLSEIRYGDIMLSRDRILFVHKNSGKVDFVQHEIISEQGHSNTALPKLFKDIIPRFTGRFWNTDGEESVLLFNINDNIPNQEGILKMLASEDENTRNYAIDIINAEKEKIKELG